MAHETQQEIQNKIKDIDAALASPYTPPPLATMLREKKGEYEKQLKDFKAVVKKEKKKSTPATEKPKLEQKKKEIKQKASDLNKEVDDLLAKLKDDAAKVFNKGRSKKELINDSHHRAHRPGKHTSKSGKVYYEERANRTDYSPEEMLHCGARIKKMITGGYVSDIQSPELKALYDYLNREIGLEFNSYIGSHRYLQPNESIYCSITTPEKQFPIFVMLSWFPGDEDIYYSIWEGTSGSEFDRPEGFISVGPFYAGDEKEIMDDISDDLARYEKDRESINDVIYKYLYEGKAYSASELIDEADASAEYDRRDAMESTDNPADFQITTLEQAIAFLGPNEVTVQEVEYKKGGRLKSALMRDRKYTSNQEWERRYNRKGGPKHYMHYKAEGGPIDSGYYKTHSDAQLWNDWTAEQRRHFLQDHFPYLGRITSDELLANFNLANLDPFEEMTYNDLKKDDNSKVSVLKLIINGVDGDYSQLDETLAEIAVLQAIEEKTINELVTLPFKSLDENLQMAIEQHRTDGQYDLGGQVATGKNISVFGYNTSNFDISPAAADEISKVAALITKTDGVSLYKQQSSALRNLAETTDDILGLQKKVLASGNISKHEVNKLNSDLILIGAYNYKMGSLVNLVFLSDVLYEIMILGVK